jgi:hypothetical protein
LDSGGVAGLKKPDIDAQAGWNFPVLVQDNRFSDPIHSP